MVQKLLNLYQQYLSLKVLVRLYSTEFKDFIINNTYHVVHKYSFFHCLLCNCAEREVI